MGESEVGEDGVEEGGDGQPIQIPLAVQLIESN